MQVVTVSSGLFNSSIRYAVHYHQYDICRERLHPARILGFPNIRVSNAQAMQKIFEPFRYSHTWPIFTTGDDEDGFVPEHTNRVQQFSLSDASPVSKPCTTTTIRQRARDGCWYTSCFNYPDTAIVPLC